MRSFIGRIGENRIGQSFLAELKKNKRCYYDGITAIVLLFVSQLLICGLEHVTRKINDFPAPILAMVLVAAVMILVERFMTDIDGVYLKYLRRPTDLINRHMSIGFTVPFTMIMNDSAWTAEEVGLIVSGFIITGLLNTAAVYALSYGVQRTISRVTGRPPGFEREMSVEAASRRSRTQPGGDLQDRGASYVSASSTLTNNPSVHYTSDDEVRTATEAGGQRQQRGPPTREGPGHQEPGEAASTMRCFWTGIWRLAAENPVPVLSLLGIAVVGFPTARANGSDAALDTFFLFFVWTGTLAAQSTVKKTGYLCRHPRRQMVLATMLNAVLWTSLGTIAYTAAKAAVKHVTIEQALDDFHTGTTLADLIYAGSQGDATMGAGDIAASILDAGIVIWGLKLFECRAQLLSRAGLTALMVGSVFAVISIVGGPLLVHAMGLIPASRALAFAARSVTIALAGPAMTSLGGDSGLNAAMVVFNGIVFQVAMGLGVCQWVTRVASRAVRLAGLGRRSRSSSSEDEDDSQVPSDTDAQARSGSSQAPTRQTSISDEEAASEARRAAAAYDVEKNAGLSKEGVEDCIVSMRGGEDVAGAEEGSCDGPRTVAVGMTVGINAAAMGTAYLYEEASQAAPYAALSMTVFGVMVVVFTSIQPLTAWLVSQVT